MDQLISVCFESLIPRAYIKGKGKRRGAQDSNSVLGTQRQGGFQSLTAR